MTDESDIHALDEQTVQRIAAGEVVERPASVVKELVENSLDADASRVDVTVERGGKDLVRVRDDGEGMTEGALKKAVKKHTTSKIRDIRDLESGVGTLGFRGEALHTIGAVSRLSITTKPRQSADGDVADVGAKLRLEGGDLEAVEPAGCPEGTTIEVTDLFYNVPARKKYLKTDRTEFARVNDVVTKYALANPEVAVSLTHDGREVFATPGQGDLQAAIMAVYGREVAQGMVELDSSFDDGLLDSLSGYVSHPETTRSSREYVSKFVNGRYVRSTTVRDAIVSAYGNQLAPDRYPFAVVFLSVPAGDIDVNVHPRKMEIRFADEDRVAEHVESAVRETLLEHGLLRSGAPRGRSAPEETHVSPMDTTSDAPSGTDSGSADAGDGSPHDGWLDRVVDEAIADTEPDPPNEEGKSPTVADHAEEPVDASADHAEEPVDASADHAEEPEDASADRVRDAASDSRPPISETHAEPATEVDAGTRPETDTPSPASEDAPRDQTGLDSPTAGTETDATQDWTAGSSFVADSTRGGASRKFAGTEQRTLSEEPATADREYDRLPPLRVLGQYADTYIVAAAPDGLVLVDQHAADERVNYERLREQFRGETTTQALAEPVALELTAGEAAVFESYADALARLGFRAERTGERTIEVRTVPVVLSDVLDPDLIRDVLAQALGDADDGDGPVEARADALLSDLACYPSITGNTSLAEGSVVDLLAALDDCENPYACPHGRPTIVHLADDEIDDRFERDYPGHAGRRD